MKKPYATYGYKPQNTTHHETTLLYINNPTFHHKPQPVLSASGFCFGGGEGLFLSGEVGGVDGFVGETAGGSEY